VKVQLNIIASLSYFEDAQVNPPTKHAKLTLHKFTMFPPDPYRHMLAIIFKVNYPLLPHPFDFLYSVLVQFKLI